MWNLTKDQLIKSADAAKSSKKRCINSNGNLLNSKAQDIDEFTIPAESDIVIQSPQRKPPSRLLGSNENSLHCTMHPHEAKNKLLTDKGQIREGNKRRFLEDIQVDHLRRKVSKEDKSDMNLGKNNQICRVKDMKKINTFKSSTQEDIQFLLKLIKHRSNSPSKARLADHDYKVRDEVSSSQADLANQRKENEVTEKKESGYMFTFN
ncbi:unnamed protein product [Moneuplotes crassus]|uniref:Uncharacterized protein n=1 Tax=Euplotes crassus TaxID=5936 RepID=A0AAD1Y639_EUPCR|nr:unnamed protein product [Moneuplotes crassus]